MDLQVYEEEDVTFSARVAKGSHETPTRSVLTEIMNPAGPEDTPMSGGGQGNKERSNLILKNKDVIQVYKRSRRSMSACSDDGAATPPPESVRVAQLERELAATRHDLERAEAECGKLGESASQWKRLAEADGVFDEQTSRARHLEKLRRQQNKLEDLCERLCLYVDADALVEASDEQSKKRLRAVRKSLEMMSTLEEEDKEEAGQGEHVAGAAVPGGDKESWGEVALVVRLKREAMEKDERLEAQEQDLCRARENEAAAVERMAELKAENEELNELTVEMQSAHARLLTMMQAVEKQKKEQQQTQGEQSSTSSAALLARVAQLEAEVAAKASEEAETRGEVDSLMEQATQLEVERDAMGAARDEAEARVRQLEAEVEMRALEEAETRAEVDALLLETDAFDMQRETQEKRAREAESRVAELERELQEFVRKVSELECLAAQRVAFAPSPLAMSRSWDMSLGTDRQAETGAEVDALLQHNERLEARNTELERRLALREFAPSPRQVARSFDRTFSIDRHHETGAEVAALLVENEELEARNSELESQLARMQRVESAPSALSSRARSWDRTFSIERTSETASQVEALLEENAQLESRVQELEEQLAQRDGGVPRSSGPSLSFLVEKNSETGAHAAALLEENECLESRVYELECQLFERVASGAQTWEEMNRLVKDQESKRIAAEEISEQEASARVTPIEGEETTVAAVRKDSSVQVSEEKGTREDHMAQLQALHLETERLAAELLAARGLLQESQQRSKSLLVAQKSRVISLTSASWKMGGLMAAIIAIFAIFLSCAVTGQGSGVDRAPLLC